MILFGLLLGMAEGDLNYFIRHHISDVPFSILGLVIGIVGLAFVFKREKGK